MIVNVLSIAGSDSSGGAGIQADLKTFSALGAYGMSVITALTAQNTQGVQAIQAVPADFVRAQLDSLFTDSVIHAVKVGMLHHVDVVSAVAAALRQYQPAFIVLDPVMVATSGDRLIDEAAIAALRTQLLPLATLITPNIPEAALLLNQAPAQTWEEMEDAATALQQLTSNAILLKGGHVMHSARSEDLLRLGTQTVRLSAPRVATRNTHGTGCTLSSAIAALLPQQTTAQTQQAAIIAAVQKAKTYLTAALNHADDLNVGQGAGAVQHFYQWWGKT